jgi:hypothetical protein
MPTVRPVHTGQVEGSAAVSRLPRSRRVRAIPVLVVLTVTASLAITAPATAAPTPARCGPLPAGYHAAGESAGCLGVRTTLAAAPRLGQEATLTVEVRATAARPDTEIRVDLPASLRFGRAPQGARVTRAASGAPRDGGQVTTATLRRGLRAGERASFTATVVPVAAGPAQITVRATGSVEPRDEGVDSAVLTVGEAGQPSTLGVTPSASALSGPAAPEVERQPFSDDPAPPPGAPPHIMATACVTGLWVYFNQVGSTIPAREWQVEAWDQDSTSLDDLLATGRTDDAGRFRLCFSNDDGFLGGGQDVYMIFRAQNPFLAMQATVGGARYAYRSKQVDNVRDGSTTEMPRVAAPLNEMRGLQAFDEMVDAYRFLRSGDHCWDGRPRAANQVCQVQILWSPGQTSWANVRCGTASSCYNTQTNTVFIAADDASFRNVVAHEAGHAVMDASYHDAFPATTNCDPHSMWQKSSVTCAWTEGFADWYGAATYGSGLFAVPTFTFDLEAATWGNPSWFQQGEDVEGRVAGALMDIADFTNEGPWDRYGEGPHIILQTLRNHVSTTFEEFWDTHRRADGFDVDTPELAATIYQNTIFFGFLYFFYDQLFDYSPLSFTSAGATESYRFNTTQNFWSVVAVRPPSFGGDTDLLLWDNPGLPVVFLKDSRRTGADVEFVAIDSNLRPFGDYAAWAAHAQASTDQYQIELAQGRDSIGVGQSQTVVLSDQQFVLVRDIFLSAGQSVSLTVIPLNGQNPELYLMRSDPNDPATWIRNSAEAASSSTGNGPGSSESVFYTAPTSGWYGMVVVNANQKGGTYLLFAN